MGLCLTKSEGSYKDINTTPIKSRNNELMLEEAEQIKLDNSDIC